MRRALLENCILVYYYHYTTFWCAGKLGVRWWRGRWEWVERGWQSKGKTRQSREVGVQKYKNRTQDVDGKVYRRHKSLCLVDCCFCCETQRN